MGIFSQKNVSRHNTLKIDILKKLVRNEVIKMKLSYPAELGK